MTAVTAAPADTGRAPAAGGTPTAGGPAPVATHCPYCALQCGMTLTPGPGPGAVTVAPRTFPTSGGGLCQKGWTSAELLRYRSG